MRGTPAIAAVIIGLVGGSGGGVGWAEGGCRGKVDGVSAVSYSSAATTAAAATVAVSGDDDTRRMEEEDECA